VFFEEGKGRGEPSRLRSPIIALRVTSANYCATLARQALLSCRGPPLPPTEADALALATRQQAIDRAGFPVHQRCVILEGGGPVHGVGGARDVTAGVRVRALRSHGPPFPIGFGPKRPSDHTARAVRGDLDARTSRARRDAIGPLL